ncbi:HlyD family type I secretion periplasmic adaptor subunit [Sphingomonas beigongshangi]|uniref:HlyD family type I secretion periplasmic adaptor subunit n=1 Tax=Sphingomonas beigongshangi TaxID=2782540 RepID=UPI00193C565D|nr:HlyD family type I secretion periplasmic adaptor subunit [Sphingomonas beigongshangi]
MNVLSRHWNVARMALADEKARAKALVRTEEVSFLPAAMELVEQPVSPTARATSWLLLIGLAIVLLWLTLARIDVVASAQGRLIPIDNVKLIQAAEAGVVKAIYVRDGQRIRAGQTLIELDPTVSSADTAQAEKALETAELDAARARAILSALDGHGLVFRAPPGTSAVVASGQAALARAQLQNIVATAAAHHADQLAAISAHGEATVQAAKLAETLPLLDEQIAANEQLLVKGFVSKLKVLEMRRQRLAAARDRDIALQTTKKAAAQMAAAGSSVIQSRAAARTKILEDLTKAEADALLRRGELDKARQRSSLQRLVSPVDGTVTQLSAHTLGGVLEAAKPIMVIVPSRGSLVAEVKVLNKDAGFVSIGQPVTIKLEAFPFTRYGTVTGRVESISSDAIENEKLGLIYTARVSLSKVHIGRDGDAREMYPGMALTADIRTGQRSILSYLVSPIDKARQEAARER